MRVLAACVVVVLCLWMTPHQMTEGVVVFGGPASVGGYGVTQGPLTLSGTAVTVESVYARVESGPLWSVCLDGASGPPLFVIECVGTMLSVSVEGLPSTPVSSGGVCGAPAGTLPSTAVALASNGTYAEVVTYVDGVASPTVGSLHTGIGSGAALRLYLGSVAPGSGTCGDVPDTAGMVGQVGELRVWDGRRSAEQIAGKIGVCTGDERVHRLLFHTLGGGVSPYASGPEVLVNRAANKAVGTDMELGSGVAVNSSVIGGPGYACPPSDDGRVGLLFNGPGSGVTGTALVGTGIRVGRRASSFNWSHKCDSGSGRNDTVLSTWLTYPAQSTPYVSVVADSATDFAVIRVGSSRVETTIPLCDGAWASYALTVITQIPLNGRVLLIKSTPKGNVGVSGEVTVGPEVYPGGGGIDRVLVLAIGQQLADVSGAAFVTGEHFSGWMGDFGVMRHSTRSEEVYGRYRMLPNTRDLVLLYQLDQAVGPSRVVANVASIDKAGSDGTFVGPVPEATMDVALGLITLQVSSVGGLSPSGKSQYVVYTMGESHAGGIDMAGLQYLALASLVNVTQVGFLAEMTSVADAGVVGGLASAAGMPLLVAGETDGTSDLITVSDPATSAMSPGAAVVNVTSGASPLAGGFVPSWSGVAPSAGAAVAIAVGGSGWVGLEYASGVSTQVWGQVGVVFEYGNCSSLLSTGQSCGPGLECCTDGSCRPLCYTLLASADFNGHHYEIVRTEFLASEATYEAFANALPYGGFSAGYLVQITSPAEYSFVQSLRISSGAPYLKIDGSDAGEEGIWVYTTGPTAGTMFYNHSSGEVFGYAPWAGTVEPNNCGCLWGEDSLELTSGGYNDLPYRFLGRVPLLAIEWGDCLTDLEPCPGNTVCNGLTGMCECAAGLSGLGCTEPCECQAPGVDPSSPCARDGACLSSTCGTGTGLPGFFGRSCDQVCPGGSGLDACSGHGVCDDGVDGSGECVSCEPGYASADCSVLCDCAGGNGVCWDGPTGDGGCLCDPGWAGVDCLTPCGGPARNCSGHGSCSAVTGACTCDPLYGTSDCSVGCPGVTADGAACSGHGTCSTETGTCTTCSDGWAGPACAIQCPVNPANNKTCSSPRGVCADGPGGDGLCVCADGYEGAACADLCPSGVCSSAASPPPPPPASTSSGNTTASVKLETEALAADSGNQQLRDVGMALGVFLVLLALAILGAVALVRKRHSIAPHTAVEGDDKDPEAGGRDLLAD